MRGATAWLVCLLAVGCSPDSHDFTPENLERVQASIKAHYAAAPDVKLSEITLIRSAAGTATGFAKLAINGAQITVLCEAKMEQQTGKFVWQCR